MDCGKSIGRAVVAFLRYLSRLVKEDFVTSGRLAILDLKEISKQFSQDLARIQLQFEFDDPARRRKMTDGLAEIRKLISPFPHLHELKTRLESSKDSSLDQYAALSAFLIGNIIDGDSPLKQNKTRRSKKAKH